MERLTTIEIAKEYLHFSAAHFTIFSATNRERLHGHNFFVAANITAVVLDNGMCFNYCQLKDDLRELCSALDEYLLLPKNSPHLQIREEANNYRVNFADEEMLFIKKDTLLLDVSNITIEELSNYLLQQLLQHHNYRGNANIHEITLRVSSGPGQWASSQWLKPE